MQQGLSLPEIHFNAQAMALAAASTFHLTGLPSATLPLDICAEAEALGAEIDFCEGKSFEFPRPAKARFATTKDIVIPSNGLDRARLPIIRDAISMVKRAIGTGAVISGLIPGPFTLLTLLTEPSSLFIEMKRKPEDVSLALFRLASFLTHIARSYRDAGADFLTIHEMGGSPGFLGLPRFEAFILPALKELIANLRSPRVLSVCGDTNQAIGLLAMCGAEAISVDQTNDLAASRTTLQNILLFGNLDPVGVLAKGDPASVRRAVNSAKQAGVDAIWPGCDLPLDTPVENLQAMML